MRLFLFAFAAAGTLFLASPPARADCPYSHCLCVGTSGVDEVEVVSVSADGRAGTGRVLAAHGTSRDAVDSVVPFDLWTGVLAVGERHLLAVDESTPPADAGTSATTTLRRELSPIVGANVVCRRTDPVFQLATADAVALALSESCEKEAAALGYRDEETTCNDTGFCASAGLGSAVFGLLALAPFARRRRTPRAV